MTIPYRPTPEEIAAKCEAIQLAWTPEEREKRIAQKSPPVTAPAFYRHHGGSGQTSFTREARPPIKNKPGPPKQV